MTMEITPPTIGPEPAREDARPDPRMRAGEAGPVGGRSRAAGPGADIAPPAGVEVRTHVTPGSLRIVTDIVDAATRAVLYRIPPQAVTDAAVRQSELISRYERLMTSTSYGGRRFGV